MLYVEVLSTFGNAFLLFATYRKWWDLETTINKIPPLTAYTQGVFKLT